MPGDDGSTDGSVEVLEQLQAEVLNLLVLSFGHAETQRRLQTLQ